MNKYNRGFIQGFSGSWGGGLGYLLIKDSKTKQVQQIPCDNAPTVRALEAVFGNVITDGHTANGSGYKGREIYWDWDGLGLILGRFCPVEEYENL